MPRYYPLLLNLEDRPVLVVGGGFIGSRKARMLAEYGARVRLVAREASPEARELAAQGVVELCERPFEPSDLDDPLVVVAATGDEALHRRIKEECDRRRIPCNVVDVPDLCSFIVPAIIRRGELMVTISTDGLCPGYSKRLRRQLSACCFTEGAEARLHVAAAAREQLRKETGRALDDEGRFACLDRLLDEELEEKIAAVGVEGACEWARRRILEIAAEAPDRGPEGEPGLCS